MFGLTKQEMAAKCPAIFSEPSPEVGKNYTHVPTFKMIHVLEEIGYYPVRVMQKGRNRFGKHMVRLRHQDYFADMMKDTVFPEVIMINSHDTTTAFKIMAGLFRVVCSNGMIISDGPTEHKCFRHISVKDEMLMSVDDLQESIPMLFEETKQMQSILMKDSEMLEFAEEAISYRFSFPVDTSLVLAARRPEDEGNTLWNVFSRVQENLIKGGYEVTNKRPVAASEIVNVDADISINRRLWDLTNRWKNQKMA